MFGKTVRLKEPIKVRNQLFFVCHFVKLSY
jgi:hypothetical protein